MAEMVLEQRVDRLEDLMAEVLRSQARTDRELERLSHDLRLSRATSEREMRELGERLETSARESREGREAWERESRESREAWQRESQEWRIEMRREWGELANRMGTMVEDLVAPSLPRILRTVAGCAADDIESAIRVRRRSTKTGQRREFDAAATCGDILFINETKTTLTPEAIKAFAERLPGVREYFPEHAQKAVVGAVASLYVDPSLVTYGERLGLIVLGFGEDVMDVLNSPGFEPRRF
jgi:hypothetical protein